MQCPKCRHTELKPTKLDDGLPAMGCTHCDGAFVSLLYYRDWIESHELSGLDATQEAAVNAVDDTKTALSCPKCSKLMTKYSVADSVDNRIDLCSSCDEAWIDGGEWTLLKSLQLADKLPSVFTDQWQRKVRTEKMAALKLERLQAIVGEEDANKAVEIKTWLKANAHKAALIQFLGSD